LILYCNFLPKRLKHLPALRYQVYPLIDSRLIDNEKESSFIRLQAIFLAISVFVFFLTGLSGKYPQVKRLILAVITCIILFLTVLGMVLIGGDKVF
jgi:hypothetical protein